MAGQIIMQSKLIERGPPDIYELPLIQTCHNQEVGFCRYAIGDPPAKLESKPEKTLLLLGAKRAGKTTMINCLANYMFGVKFSDNFRFKVATDSEIQPNCQTKEITAYTLHSTIVDYSLTVIDTPGFGDACGGVESDMHTITKIKSILGSEIESGIDCLHGIGLVTKASVARLTPMQKYIFHLGLSILGKDFVNNIFLFATFADGGTPHILDAVTSLNIEFQGCFKFNNSALYARSDAYFDSMFWEIGRESFSDFMVCFTKMNKIGLALTRKVTKERQQLKTALTGLQIAVQVSLKLMDAIMLSKNQKFSEKIVNRYHPCHCDQSKVKKVHLPEGASKTSCKNCSNICGPNCIASDDMSKTDCSAVNGGYCTVGLDDSHWSDHSSVPYSFESMEGKNIDYEDLKTEFHKEESKKPHEHLLDQTIQELEIVLPQVIDLVKQARASNDNLGEMALRSCPMIDAENLTLLIDSEETKKSSDWKKRVSQLRICLMEAQILKVASYLEVEVCSNRDKFKTLLLSCTTSTQHM